VRSGQETINMLTDLSRNEAYGRDDNGQSSKIAIETVGSISIPQFLARKAKPMELCFFNSLKSEGIDNLSDLIEEIEFEKKKNKLAILTFIEKSFPKNLLNIASNFDKSLNIDQLTLTHFYMGNDQFVPVESVTVKQLQKRLKITMNKVTVVDYNTRLGAQHFDINNINIIRSQVKNAKLRNVFYRLINKDFYNKTKMLKYKMINDDECDRCRAPETIEHLLWECRGSLFAWKNYNDIVSSLGFKVGQVNSYKDIYNFNNNAGVNTIKLKLINELIQIARPINLNKERIKTIINNLINTEKYIAVKNNQLTKFYNKWKQFL
jgi:hypothetical protein